MRLGRRGKTARLKRKPAPRLWPIHRKEYVWVAKPSSGPHSLDKCLTLTLVLRDILGMAQTRKEAQTIVNQGKVFVNGIVRRKDDFPVGLMDVVTMPDAYKFFRIMPYKKGLYLNPILKDEASFKLSRVEDKTIVNGGHIQYRLHDGSTMLVKVADPKNPHEDVYETFDVLKLSLPEKQALECVNVKEGNFAAITGGKNIGVQGKIVEIEKTEAKKRRNALVIVEDEKGNRYQTILNFVFSLGTPMPLATSAEATPVV
jgi:small subunit ribosomal protein S4e